MKITVNRNNVIRKWPRVEAYQNSTLRYTPPKDFPAYCREQIGAPEIIRTWVTLDEVWDYRTDTYNWDYDIGVNNYVDDKNHYTYDWGITVPLGQNSSSICIPTARRQRRCCSTSAATNAR